MLIKQIPDTFTHCEANFFLFHRTISFCYVHMKKVAALHLLKTEVIHPHKRKLLEKAH